MANERTDDGYRGLLRNPVTGRVFKANAVTVLRGDLDRVSSPDAEAGVSTGIQPPAATAAPQPVTSTPDATQTVDQTEANQMLVDLLAQSRGTDDRELLKGLGAQIGLKLTANMNEKTMRDRIEKQIEKIQAAGG